MKKTISRTRILAFLLSLAILAMVVPQGMVAEAVEETMSIVNLKTDGLLDPLGIDTTEPVFSWQMDSDLVGAKQAAYQVVVKDDAGKVVWDSGQVKQSESIGIRYEGEELKAATRYTWTVAVTDNSGDTVTSEPATFETGLMSTAQWDADWIGGELTMYARTMQFFDFTAELQIPEGSEKASVVLFADEFRLKNSVFNTRRLENDVNYMRYEVDLTDESSPKLNIYVVGYTDGAGDPENTPNRTIDIPAEALGADNAHDWISISIGNNRTCSINGVSVGAPTGIPSIGSRISMLGSIGFAVPANGEAVYKNMQVFQNGGRYTTRECVFGPSTGATYAIFEEMPGVAVREDQITVTGGASGNLQYADPSYGSEPMVRKQFSTQNGKTIKSARVYATAQGIFEAYVNGEKLGENEWLAPGYNEYREQMPYETYDVTDLLNAGGENVIGAQLGEGWWTGYWTHMNIANYYGDQPAFMAQLVITYTDGTSERIVTDSTWSYTHEGPVEYASLIMGERYNALTAEAMEGWAEPGYTPKEEWKPANVIPTRKAFQNYEMVTRYDEPVRVYDELTAQDVWATRSEFGESNNSYIYDMGENISGNPQLIIPDGYVDEGAEVIIRMAEVLYPEATEEASQEAIDAGYFNEDIAGMLMCENYRTALSTDFYIAKAGDQVYEPHFTQHGYRYLEITGLNKPLPKENVKTLVLSSVEITSTFESSNPLVDRLFKNAQNSQSSNYISLPTDCPQRNERLGWLGDAQVFSVTAAYNADVYEFVRNFMRTLRSEQDERGALPIYAPSHPNYDLETGELLGLMLPGQAGGDGNGCISWSGAIILMPYNAYKAYGDTRIIEENFDTMVKYLNFLDEGDVYVGVDNGDGTYGQRLEPALTTKSGGLADHLSRVSTDSNLLNNALYGYLYKITSEMAEAIGRDDLVDEYYEHYLDTREAWNRVYLDPETGKTQTAASYNPATGAYTAPRIQDTQSSYANALRYDMVTDERVIDHYLETIRNASASSINDGYPVYDYSITTGFSGTPNVVPALSKYGYVEDAYKMLEQTEYASWLYPVTQGATSIWERWNGFTLESGFAGQNGMNSFNHFAFGAISEWMMAYQLGITTDGAGYHDFVLQPTPGGSFTYSKGSFESAYGRICSGWEYKDNGDFLYSAVVPANSTATLYLPVEQDALSQFVNIDGVTFAGMTERNRQTVAQFTLQAGSYQFTVSDGVLSASLQDGVVSSSQADKSILRRVLSYAEAAYASDEFDTVIADVQESFAAALHAAREIDADLNAGQEEVDTAWINLMKEIHKLGFVRGDKTALGLLIEVAESYQAQIDRYTPSTAQPFTAQLTSAKATFEDGNAMQGDVAEAERALLDAMVNLRYRADKSVLEAVLAEASEIDTAAYTAQSVAAFQAANEEAIAVRDNADATQEEVNNAVDKLKEAIGGLAATEPAANQNNGVNGDATLTTGSGNAKTGDAAPITVALSILLLAGAGLLRSKKKG